MIRPWPPGEIRIRRHALEKLLLYAERCPVEIGGLGTVERDAEGLLITDLFLLPQRGSSAETELDTGALFDFLGRLLAEGRDVGSVRLWWHSHVDMDLTWSATDCATIGNLPGEFWVALVVNRRREVQCRLDAFAPHRQTWELPLVAVPDSEGRDRESLRAAIEQEIRENVQAYAVVSEVVGSEGISEVVTEYPIALEFEPRGASAHTDNASKRK